MYPVSAMLGKWCAIVRIPPGTLFIGNFPQGMFTGHLAVPCGAAEGDHVPVSAMSVPVSIRVEGGGLTIVGFPEEPRTLTHGGKVSLENGVVLWANVLAPKVAEVLDRRLKEGS
jgi:hypothetical protein